MKVAENTNNNLSFIVCILYFVFFSVFLPSSRKRLSNVIEMINLDGRKKICNQSTNMFVYMYESAKGISCLFLGRNFVSFFFFLWLRKHLFMAFHTYIPSKGFPVDMLLILRFQTFDSGLIDEWFCMCGYFWIFLNHFYHLYY